jgi:LacI family transcriptional regulator
VLNGTVPVAPGTRRRVMKAIEELDYRPNALARALATNRSNGVGVTVNDLSSPYFGAMLKGIEEVVVEAGMHLVVLSGSAEVETERRALHYLQDGRTDAMVLHCEALPDEELIGLAVGGLPLALIGRYVPEIEQQCVWLDNEAGGDMATEHLIERGHRRIGHISGPLSFPDSRARLLGYRRALERAGIAYDERLVLEGDFREERGYRATRRLLERDLGITALFCANDQSAAGAFRAVRDAGLSIADDISLIGYDDVLLARYLHPALTTVAQPLRDMGRAAAEISLGILNERGAEVRHRFHPALIERQSVATLR